MASNSFDPPFRQAVLVPCPVTDDTPAGWTVIFAKGDPASARGAAEQWALSHLGQSALLVTVTDGCTAAPVASWGRP